MFALYMHIPFLKAQYSLIWQLTCRSGLDDALTPQALQGISFTFEKLTDRKKFNIYIETYGICIVYIGFPFFSCKPNKIVTFVHPYKYVQCNPKMIDHTFTSFDAFPSIPIHM